MKKLFLIVSVLSMAFGFAAHAAPNPKFRLCTGDPAKNYFKAGHILKKNSTSVEIEVVSTKGSLNNLDMIVEGACDGAFVQSDAIMVASDKNPVLISAIERAGVLYREDAHLLCNRSAGLGGIWDLTPKHKVAIGSAGSGSQVTWEAFVLANKKKYGAIPTDSRDGLRAVNAVADGSQVQCLLSVASLGTSLMKNDAQQVAERVVLTRTDDSGLDRVSKDARGQSVYTYSEVPSGTYPAIQPAGTVYGTKAVGTIAVDALFVTSVKWIGDNETTNDKLLRAFNASLPEIKKLAGQK